jgi:hypothetical protein
MNNRSIRFLVSPTANFTPSLAPWFSALKFEKCGAEKFAEGDRT